MSIHNALDHVHHSATLIKNVFENLESGAGRFEGRLALVKENKLLSADPELVRNGIEELTEMFRKPTVGDEKQNALEILQTEKIPEILKSVMLCGVFAVEDEVTINTKPTKDISKAAAACIVAMKEVRGMRVEEDPDLPRLINAIDSFYAQPGTVQGYTHLQEANMIVKTIQNELGLDKTVSTICEKKLRSPDQETVLEGLHELDKMIGDPTAPWKRDKVDSWMLERCHAYDIMRELCHPGGDRISTERFATCGNGPLLSEISHEAVEVLFKMRALIHRGGLQESDDMIKAQLKEMLDNLKEAPGTVDYFSKSSKITCILRCV